ncbi:MAG: YraN family protein [Cyclobacteriaceae bacterium]|nr:YraN family protein [Cyclobacteriaceae bacterium]
MTDKIKRGAEGEQLAALFLEKQGFTILNRNYRYRKSEIDLVACRGNWLLFVEVKTRTSIEFGFPEAFVDYKKKKKIFEGAEQYMFEKNWKGNVRFDIVSVNLMDGHPEIRHIEDAFY